MSSPEDDDRVSFAAYARETDESFEVEVLVSPKASPEMIYAVAKTMLKAAEAAHAAGGTQALADRAPKLDFNAPDDDTELN